MTHKSSRRVASVAAAVLYIAALSLGWSPWFLIITVAIVALEFWIQRTTETGWRMFRTDLDERQAELQNRILAISYRVVIGLVLLIMVFLAGFGWYFDAPRSLAIPGQFSALATRLLAFIVVMLFLLPGHVSAWLEPLLEERTSEPSRRDELGAES